MRFATMFPLGYPLLGVELSACGQADGRTFFEGYCAEQRISPDNIVIAVDLPHAVPVAGPPHLPDGLSGRHEQSLRLARDAVGFWRK